MSDKTKTARPEPRRPWTTPRLQTLPAHQAQAAPNPVVNEGPFAFGS